MKDREVLNERAALLLVIALSAAATLAMWHGTRTLVESPLMASFLESDQRGGGGMYLGNSWSVSTEGIADGNRTAVLSPYALGRSSGDSTGGMYEEDPHAYSVCTFSNVCLSSAGMHIQVADPVRRSLLNTAAALCGSPDPSDRAPFCNCFSRTFPAVFEDPMLSGARRWERGSHVLVDTYVKGHQIGHWIEKLVLLHSVLLHAPLYPALSSVDGIIFNRLDPPLTEHEAFVLRVATARLPSALDARHMLWSRDFESTVVSTGARVVGSRCFERVTYSPLLATIAHSAADANAYRARAYALAWQDSAARPEERQLLASSLRPLSETCPPPRALLLFRAEDMWPRRRLILNGHELAVAVLAELGIHFELVTISASNTTAEQLALFASAGLVVSSHSSQLANVVFAPPRAAVVEVTPMFQNGDFAAIALPMGLAYWYALDGAADSADSRVQDAFREARLAEEGQREILNSCLQRFLACDGEALCLIQADADLPEECHARTSPYKLMQKGVKHVDFYTNIKTVMRILKKAVGHLNAACGGRWPGLS